jgi:hypothetical protein
MPATINPYAPPKAQVEDVVPFAGEADAIRREHIQREAAIRSIGILYYLGGGGLVLAAIGFLAGFGGKQLSGGLPVALFGVIFLVFGLGMIFVGRGIRSLRPWARITAIVLAILLLLRPPAGTLINIYILYLLFSEKGRRIFESDYPEIVAATPDVKSRTSIVVWVFLGILVLVLLAVSLILAFGKLT